MSIDNENQRGTVSGATTAEKTDTGASTATNDAAERMMQSSLGNELEFLVARASSIGNARANSRLAPLGLKVRSYSILSLACTTSGVSQRDLADFLCLDPSQIVALVDGLEQSGFVERLADPRDRRSNVIRGTGAGRKMYKRASEAVSAAEEVSLQQLNDDERALLRSLLRKLAFVPVD